MPSSAPLMRSPGPGATVRRQSDRPTQYRPGTVLGGRPRIRAAAGPRVLARSDAFLLYSAMVAPATVDPRGAVAHQGERFNGIEEVRGSSPRSSTPGKHRERPDGVGKVRGSSPRSSTPGKHRERPDGVGKVRGSSPRSSTPGKHRERPDRVGKVRGSSPRSSTPVAPARYALCLRPEKSQKRAVLYRLRRRCRTASRTA